MSDYMFEPAATEPVPTAWLTSTLAIPVNERSTFIMDAERDPAWSVDVHDHWDDTPIILKAADELP